MALKLMCVFKSNTIPTDLELLKEIYKRYSSEFGQSSENDVKKDSENYIPIDIPALAQHFNTTKHIIFGRLYYALNRKYEYTKEGGHKVDLFAPVFGKDKNCINLPLLTSVVSGLQEQLSYFNKTLTISIFAAFISIVSLISSLYFSIHTSRKDEAIVRAIMKIYEGQDQQRNSRLQFQEQTKISNNKENRAVYYCPKCHTSNKIKDK